MNPKQSEKLVAMIFDLVQHAPMEKVIRTYDGLSHVLSDPKEREACGRIAFMYREARSLQRSHQRKHNGNGHGNGHKGGKHS